MYEKAVSFDSSFAEAWAHICRLRIYLISLGETGEYGLDDCKSAGDMAFSLDDKSVEAEIALGRIRGDDPYPEENLTRARRLTRGARLALAEGDLSRAIRRAFYACQLLGARSP